MKALAACLLGFGVACARAQGTPLPANEASCVFAAGPDSDSCDVSRAIFHAAPLSHRPVQSRQFTEVTTYGPGWNFGNAGGWRVQKNIDGMAVMATRGIHQYMDGNIRCQAVGDCALYYGWGYSDGGVAAQSDEGTTMATFSGGETTGYFHGRVKTGGLGAREPQLEFTSGNNWTTDGAFLLDISKGAVAGYLNGYSKTVANFKPWLNYLPVTQVKLPVTSAWGEVLPADEKALAIPNPEVTANLPKAVEVRVRLMKIGDRTTALVAGGVVCVAGSDFPEQAKLRSAGPVRDGVQEVTVEVRNPNTHAILFQGGICGQFLSFDANLKVSGYRTSYYAFGSLTGDDLIYGANLAGGLGKREIPDPSGSEAEAVEGVNAGFHLYPGAEIVTNRSTGAEPTLEANSVNWEPRDEVENPHYPYFGGSGLWLNFAQNSPTSGYFKSNGINVSLYGPGVSGAFRPMMIYNGQAASVYRAGGGLLSAPMMFSTGGSFGDYFNFETGPQPTATGANAVVTIHRTAAGGNAVFNLFDLMRRGEEHGSQISYDPASGTTSFDFLHAQGFVSAPVVVTTQGTPTSSASACVPNSSWDDDDYHYHCLSSGKSIKRVALGSF